MKQDKKLMLGMTLLFLITFVSLGTLVATEKLSPYFTNKMKEKFETYIEKEYKDEKDEFKIEKITYKNQKYQAKVSNKGNKNLYFIISYQNKKITDTYKKDYLKGKTLLNTIEKELEQKIKREMNKKVIINFPLTLDKYTTQVKENLIKNDLNNINLYNIEFSINNNLEPNSITEKIQNIIQKLNSININPNEYKITINNKNKTLTINNLTTQTLEKNNLLQIINDIINNNESDIIKTNNITYEYTNKGE